MKKVERSDFLWLWIITANAIKNIDPRMKKKATKVYPIGDCNLTQNFTAIAQETNRLDPLIFKNSGNISYIINFF